MRRVVSGSFELPVPATEAISFFTPEGERDWVSGWDPVYAAGEKSESPGTVFVTHAGHAPTIWVVNQIDRQGCSSAYVRVTPGHHAGTVEVQCADRAGGGCVVSVTYDMSLLPGSNAEELAVYDDASFAAMMDEWARGVIKALAL